MTMPAALVGDEIGARLRAATVAHRDAQEVAHDRAREWRKLVLEAVDAGMKIKDVAELAGISSSRVNAIVLKESAS